MATSIPSQLQKASTADPSFEPLLDSTEAASLLRIHPKTLQRMAGTTRLELATSAVTGQGCRVLSTT